MELLTWVHVVSGCVSVPAGFLALTLPKGRAGHRRAGLAFVASMLPMAASGTALALIKPMPISMIAGLATLYFVASAWAAVRARQHRPWALALASGSGLLAACAAALGLQAPGEGPATAAAGPFYFFSAVLGLAAVLDLHLAWRPRLVGRHRQARHLWRMCFALFMATGSLFTGPGARMFPDDWRQSAWMSLPELLILAAMVGGLLRLGVGGWRTAPPSPQRSGDGPAPTGPD